MKIIHECFLFSVLFRSGMPGSSCRKTKNPSAFRLTGVTWSAERGGFEPPVRLPVRQFSKLLV